MIEFAGRLDRGSLRRELDGRRVGAASCSLDGAIRQKCYVLPTEAIAVSRNAAWSAHYIGGTGGRRDGCQAPGTLPMSQPNPETIRTPGPLTYSGRNASRIASANRPGWRDAGLARTAPPQRAPGRQVEVGQSLMTPPCPGW